MTTTLSAALMAGPVTGKVLQAQLGVSQPTVSRLVRAHADTVIALGRGPATRYALRRPIPGLGSEHPVYRIARSGAASSLGVLTSLWGGYWFENLEHAAGSRFFDGLPWFLSDMRPQGFLGRSFAQRMTDQGLPDRLSDWQDDHVLIALSRHGLDAPGNLIVGGAAVRAWSVTAADVMPPEARALCYPRLADEALAGEAVGSSAAGEQPKFTALRAGAEPVAVIVKFSGDVQTPIGRRWSDLLLAEHHALTVMRRQGRSAAMSELLQHDGRTFLEVRRFDRAGARGRLGMISLGAFDDEFVGRRRNWHETAQALARQRLLSAEAVAGIAWQQAYAELIANTDRHFGNLSLYFDGHWPAALAPAYDMLPMHDAPKSDGATPLVPFLPALPVGYGDAIARSASEAAALFWGEVAGDTRISEAYRDEAARRQRRVAALQTQLPHG